MARPPRLVSATPSPGLFATFACRLLVGGTAVGYGYSVNNADPFLWLEGITDDAALEWVNNQNEWTAQTLAGAPGFAETQATLLEVLDSESRIPFVEEHGDYYYNFWQDNQHVRGVWRRTDLDSYICDNPDWETVLDLDALSEQEDTHWVWHGANFLSATSPKVLLTLSPGGADADVTREFDLATKRFIPANEGGFTRGVAQGGAKGGMDWVTENQVVVYTDQGPDTLTNAGYPRFAQLWQRGTPLSAAVTLLAGRPEDEYVFGYAQTTPGYERVVVQRKPTFFTSETFIVTGSDHQLTKLDIPDSAMYRLFRDWLLIELREDWQLASITYPAGALLAARLSDYLAGSRDLAVLFNPTANTALQDATWTRHFLVITVLTDVKHCVYVLTPPTHGNLWETNLVESIDPLTTITVRAVDRDESDDVWLTTTGYLTPPTLALGTVTKTGITSKPLKHSPTFFAASNLAVEQYFAKSDDGTLVPYFVVGPKDVVAGHGSEPAATLLYGYGGFQKSLTPAYRGTEGRAWLAKGGVYVEANIRGGGEYGPNWHRAALKDNRHKAYEDFAAVARDLIAKGITIPQLLAVQGRSNGGLLTGNMLAKYPELFGAVIIQAPLLDMQRYSHLLAGASWMAEYGDPDDPAQWEWLQQYSPYQLVKQNHLANRSGNYPPVLITTSTRDDRVHPGHARKMAALLESIGADVNYYENTEGGHGGSATNEQTAYVEALVWTFLSQHLK